MGDLGLDGKMIIELILKQQDLKRWIRIEHTGWLCE
jgi:hypothetical protein